MSRIYEALQKAESERAGDRKEQELPAEPPQPPISESREPVREETPRALYSVAAELEDHPVMPKPQDYPPAPKPVVSGQGLALDQIVPRPWSIAINQLPSLLERGAVVEQFRSLRSRLFELRDVKPLKSIVITSGLPQEGKSFVSTNLALSLARHKNSKVLLIDGDMRRYTLHQILGCESFPGLADYLSGNATAVEVMQRPEVNDDMPAVVRPVLANLTFISGGNGGDKAADLSGSPRFAELLRLAAPHFDWIIVDSSPVLPVSDAVNLSRACDGVLLVARSGVTKFQIAQRAQSELKSANVLGFVLNAVAHEAHAGGYYGYGYGYGYGHDAAADQ